MKQELILQTLNDKDLKKALTILTEKNLLANGTNCKICADPLKGNIGGFIPSKKKVSPICNKFSCILEGTYLVMKHNGNGSPKLRV